MEYKISKSYFVLEKNLSNWNKKGNHILRNKKRAKPFGFALSSSKIDSSYLLIKYS